jgi:hypothetical protein
LDWHCYEYYGLVDEAPILRTGSPPSLERGQRAFELLLARNGMPWDRRWFEYHGITPTAEIPDHWPQPYKKVVAQRLELIESNENIRLIEQPDYKRRWDWESWDTEETRALRSWLLDRLESAAYWPRQSGAPRLRSALDVADQAARDHEFLEVAALFEKRSDFDLKRLVAGLLAGEAVPFLPILRYKDSGLRKRRDWERTWELQRAEDRGEDPGKIPVPPKYESKDFKSAAFWRLRGKLDVPRERFVSFPHLERDLDGSAVFGWAGWSHLERAQALATYFDERKERDGWEPARLLPILAGIEDLVPWLLQWHNDVDPASGVRIGEFYRGFAPEEARKLAKTIDDVRAWTPPASRRGGRRGGKRKDAATADEEKPSE